MKQKNTAAVLALVLGGVGGHKFYLGQIGWGLAYALFFWTYIPTIVGFIEGILLLNMSQEDFDQKYNRAALIGYQSRQLTNNPPPQVIVNIGDQAIASNFSPAVPADENLAKEAIERRILKLCQTKGEVTLLELSGH